MLHVITVLLSIYTVVFLEESLDPVKLECLEQLPYARPFGQLSGLDNFPVYRKLTLNLDYGK